MIPVKVLRNVPLPFAPVSAAPCAERCEDRLNPSAVPGRPVTTADLSRIGLTEMLLCGIGVKDSEPSPVYRRMRARVTVIRGEWFTILHSRWGSGSDQGGGICKAMPPKPAFPLPGIHGPV